MMSKQAPPNFNKRFDIVGCFLMHDNHFLMLHRHPHKASGNQWGLPAGKAEPGEALKDALLREVAEETGVELGPESVHFFDSYYVMHGDFHIMWHVFYAHMETKPSITLSPSEHSEYRWVTEEESLALNLIHDQDDSIKLFFAC